MIRGYKGYLLNVLLVILAFNYVDRSALGLVLQDIKHDLALSDTQLGLLTGIAFALFYSVMGLPIARWADRGNRVTIIATTTLLWSVAVAASGFATGFVQLMLIRACVAVGEAGCVPPAQSLIADTFSRAERPRAAARYMLGTPLSCVIGYFVAGWLNEHYGWRVMFMLLGLPGLLLAMVAWLTLREPRQLPAAQACSPAPSVVCAVLWRTETFRHLVLAFAVIYLFGYGLSNWQPAFLMRSFGLQTGELGAWLAAIYGLGGLAGTWLGGEWAARRAAGNERLQLRAIAIVHVCFGALSTLIYLAPNAYVAFAWLTVATVGVTAAIGPLYATIQTLVPERMRAIAIALILLFANLIGLGFGPLVAGALSDLLQPWAGAESLRYALLALCPGYLWGAWHLWRASNSVSREVAVAA